MIIIGTQTEIPTELFSPRQLEFMVEGMTLSLQIIDGDVIWANMPEYVTLPVVVRGAILCAY